MIFSNLVTPAGKRVEPFQVPLNNVEENVHHDFNDAIVFPGLTNSHDHLDFNLFPQLGNKLYEDYIHWGNDIHLNYKNQINAVLAVPKQLRVQYGLYKNLLAGITTVVNHGENLLLNDPVINVLQPACLHSVGFEKNWKLK
jgi:cytosine/adenosine deaminase-related metal-dependent hydrolase